LHSFSFCLSLHDALPIFLILCAAHFLFWYGVHLFGNDEITSALARYETWDYITVGDPEGRIEINKRLAGVPGKQLVFVRYSPLQDRKSTRLNSSHLGISY